MNSEQCFKRILSNNLNGAKEGTFSVCSSNPTVIEASLQEAKKNHSLVVIESTSHQVNQYGGYSGLNPKEFIEAVRKKASKIGLSSNNILFGGDHLGPVAWSEQSCERAMEQAKTMVAEYSKAGFKKIHLDASMKLLGDEEKNRDEFEELVAERTAELCKVIEEVGFNSDEKPMYVIGSEVPIPGGGKADSEDTLPVTTPEELSRTIELTRRSFEKLGLESAWERIVAIVTEAGIEFSSNSIKEYDSHKNQTLKKYIHEENHLVLEAHSTDYQTVENLEKMVQDHYAILKVGPAMTFAYREALFALADIEGELKFERKSELKRTLVEVMKEDSKYWEKYYSGDIEFNLKYSLSDRCRYYWTQEKLRNSIELLLYNLNEAKIPFGLWSQYLPETKGIYSNFESIEGVIHWKIEQVLSSYSRACGYKKLEEY